MKSPLRLGIASGCSLLLALSACAESSPPPPPAPASASATSSDAQDDAFKADLVTMCSAPTQAPGASNAALSSSQRSEIIAEWTAKRAKTERFKQLLRDLSTMSVEPRRQRLRAELSAQAITSCELLDVAM